MYRISSFIEDYKSLQEDYNLLQAVYKKMLKCLVETSDIEDLIQHNHEYRQRLVALVQDNFPVTANDIRKWSVEEFECWLKLLIECPVFWQGKEETLLGLLWTLDSKARIKQEREVALLCTHQNMVDFAADARNKSVVQTLDFLINKYATLSQAEQFQNKVALLTSETS